GAQELVSNIATLNGILVDSLIELEADLERMGARDVRRRKPLNVAVVDLGAPVATEGPGVVPEASSQVQNGKIIRRDLWLPHAIVPSDDCGCAGFEQQSAGDRRVPCHQIQSLRRPAQRSQRFYCSVVGE